MTEDKSISNFLHPSIFAIVGIIDCTDISRFTMSTTLISVVICLLTCSTTHSKINTAEWLANRTITKFLTTLTDLPKGNPHRQAAISSVIRVSEGEPERCLQEDKDGNCIWKLTQAVRSVTKRSTSLVNRETTREFIANFIQKLAQKSFPFLKNQILSIFSNDSASFLKLPTDTVKRVEVASNLILLRSIEKIYEATSRVQKLRVPLLTLCSIIVVLILMLVASCLAKQISEIRTRRSMSKQRKLEAYFTRRTLQQQMNQRSPSYEAVQID